MAGSSPAMTSEGGGWRIIAGSAPHEGMVDNRLLLGGQRLIERFERRARLLQPLQPGGEELLLPAGPVEDRPLTAFRRQRGAELALFVRRRLHRGLQPVP